MASRPENLTAFPEGGLDTNTTFDMSIQVNGAIHNEKERPKKRPSSLNPTIATTNTMNAAITSVGSSTTTGASTSAGSSTSATTGASTSSASKNKADANASTDRPSISASNLLPNAADVGGGKSRLQERWTAEEEKKLASAVDTFGTASWAAIAANLPGQNETQCRQKWGYNMSRKAATTARGAWTAENKKKLSSEVETLGTTSWTNISSSIPGRNETQCSQKWRNMSKKAAATASSAWTVEEENMLVYAVETYYGGNWAEIAKMFPGRNESQCHQQWLRVSEETAGAEPPKKRRRFDWV
jgi:hypothetical protein